MGETSDDSKAFGPVLDGISIPDTVVLPPEVVMLLPWMSLAELKVVIAAVARLMQVGGAEPITLSEFEQLTGLSRPAVLDGIERAMKRGLLMRFEMTGYRGHTMHVYELKPRVIGGNFPPIGGSIGKDFIGKKFLPITPVKAKQSKVNVVDSELTTFLKRWNDIRKMRLDFGDISIRPNPHGIRGIWFIRMTAKGTKKLSRGKNKNHGERVCLGTALTKHKDSPLGQPYKNKGTALWDSPKKIKGQPLTFQTAPKSPLFFIGGYVSIPLIKQAF